MGLFRRRRREPRPSITVAGADAPVASGGPSRSFGYKGAWLAIRAAGAAEVADALGLEAIEPVAWADGVAAVYDAPLQARPAPVFAGGPVDGWILVPLSSPLAEAGALDLAALSTRFGEVQRFATHRVVEAHEWERWVGGQPVRRYGYLGESGEIRFNEGEPTEQEEDLLPDTHADPDDWELADEDRVMEVAAAWSVDPTTLDDRDDVGDTGLLGRC